MRFFIGILFFSLFHVVLAETRAQKTLERGPSDVHANCVQIISEPMHDPDFAQDKAFFADSRIFKNRGKHSEASRRSRSKAHYGSSGTSARPPQSNSIDAGTIGTDRAAPSTSASVPTLGRGRPPLNQSERDRYFGVGGREIGLNFGTAHSITDLQNSKGIGFSESINYQIRNPGITMGVYSRIRMVEWFGLSVGFDLARLSGTANGNLAEFEGYSFENNLVEFNARIAFFAPLATRNTFDIYGFAGLALFVNNLVLRNANGIEIPVTGDFNMLQPALPFGMGLSWVIGYRMVLGYELGYRYTSFNMLDGVAPADTRFDAYFFNTLRVGFILKPSRR